MRRLVDGLGRGAEATLDGAGYGLQLLLSGVACTPHVVQRRRFVLGQLYTCGIRPLPVVLVVAAFTGMILALQTGIELQRFGAQDRVASIIGVGLCREMGPFMTALILTASVGAGMAAELGTMKVSEEIDALEVMSIPPPSFLVMPRVLAMAIMSPLLTLVADVVGVAGGSLVSATRLGISPQTYYNEVIDALSGTSWVFGLPKDLYTGLIKSVVFGVILATVGCAAGLRTSGGAMGVGRATRRAVIQSFLLIIVIGYYMTSLFYS